MSTDATVSAPIPLSSQETIAFIGDSITEQNLYTAYIETFLISRLPEKQLRFWNIGWGGDVAQRGHQRFSRDCMGLKPSMVLVNFGMNDGTYCPPRADIKARWLAGITTLVDDIRSVGARPVLMSTNPVDDAAQAFLRRYNETLAEFAGALRSYSSAENIPLIDCFPAMFAVQAKAKQALTAFTMIPDGVHPNAVGHLVMAYSAISRFAAPRRLGRLWASPTGISTDGNLRIQGLQMSASAVECDLELPFIPFWVPSDAREALRLVPFQNDLNYFMLSTNGWPSGAHLSLWVDQVEVAVLSPQQLRDSVDLTLLDKATWARQGQELWRQAQQRFSMHHLAWRRLALEDPCEAQRLPSHQRLCAALTDYLTDSSEMLRQLAVPRRYHLRIELSTEILLSDADISPLYPFAADSSEDFHRQHPPEQAFPPVAWSRLSWKQHSINLGEHFGSPSNCVSYVRVYLHAEAPSTLRLLLGSDDGLSVILNGQRLLDHNVFRACTLGDERLEAAIPGGQSLLLLRVTQGGGGYALALRLMLLTGGPVRQVWPEPISPKSQS